MTPIEQETKTAMEALAAKNAALTKKEKREKILAMSKKCFEAVHKRVREGKDEEKYLGLTIWDEMPRILFEEVCYVAGLAHTFEEMVEELNA